MSEKRSGDEYGTPLVFYEMLNQRFHFLLDPCTTLGNPLGTPYFHTLLDNGLNTEWDYGGPVFMNPPYSAGNIAKWIEKAYRESLKGVLVVGLVRHDPSTRWWNKFVKDKCFVWPVPYRLRFVGGDGCYNFPSAVVIWTGFPSERMG